VQRGHDLGGQQDRRKKENSAHKEISDSLPGDTTKETSKKNNTEIHPDNQTGGVKKTKREKIRNVIHEGPEEKKALSKNA